MEEKFTFTKTELLSIVNDTTNKVINKALTEFSLKITGSTVDMEEHLQSKRSMLETDLNYTFPEFAAIRKHIFIKSFLINHAQKFQEDTTYDASDILQFAIGDKDDQLMLFSGIAEDEIKSLLELLKGISTKRLNRGVVNIKATKDENEEENVTNPFRQPFLNFLKVCYSRSGCINFFIFILI